ncbi:MAG: hypothetical protein ABSB49_06735 [Polyangia bacterium]|jgi:hypothetical protein
MLRSLKDTWFRGVGTEKNAGTKIFSLSGKRYTGLLGALADLHSGRFEGAAVLLAP